MSPSAGTPQPGRGTPDGGVASLSAPPAGREPADGCGGASAPSIADAGRRPSSTGAPGTPGAADDAPASVRVGSAAWSTVVVFPVGEGDGEDGDGEDVAVGASEAGDAPTDDAAADEDPTDDDPADGEAPAGEADDEAAGVRGTTCVRAAAASSSAWPRDGPPPAGCCGPAAKGEDVAGRSPACWVAGSFGRAKGPEGAPVIGLRPAACCTPAYDPAPTWGEPDGGDQDRPCPDGGVATAAAEEAGAEDGADDCCAREPPTIPEAVSAANTAPAAASTARTTTAMSDPSVTDRVWRLTSAAVTDTTAPGTARRGAAGSTDAPTARPPPTTRAGSSPAGSKLVKKVARKARTPSPAVARAAIRPGPVGTPAAACEAVEDVVVPGETDDGADGADGADGGRPGPRAP